MIGTILLVVILAFAALGLVIGFVKGFTNVKSWAVELVVAGAVCAGISNAAAKVGGDKSPLPAIITIIVAVAGLLLTMLLMEILRKVLRKVRKKRYERKLEEYEDGDGLDDYDFELVDNDEDGLGEYDFDIVATRKDKKKAKKNKPKEPKGACGIVDRIIGAIVLAVKGAVMLGIIISILLVAVDLIQFDSLTKVFADVYKDKMWLAFKPQIMNMLVIFILLLCIRSGFSSGLLSSLWGIVIFALVAVAGFSAYHLAFKVATFQPAAEALGENLGKIEFIKTITQYIPSFTTLTLARIIITAGIFLLFVVVIILLKIFVPRLIGVARNGSTFYTIDGILGALVLSIIVFGLLLFVGFVIEPLKDFGFMAKFTAYFKDGGIASYLYTKNVLTTVGFMPEVGEKIRGFFTVNA